MTWCGVTQWQSTVFWAATPRYLVTIQRMKFQQNSFWKRLSQNKVANNLYVMNVIFAWKERVIQFIVYFSSFSHWIEYWMYLGKAWRLQRDTNSVHFLVLGHLTDWEDYPTNDHHPWSSLQDCTECEAQVCWLWSWQRRRCCGWWLVTWVSVNIIPKLGSESSVDVGQARS